MFMSSGTGWLTISWKNFSPSSILLSHSARPWGCFGFHQNSVRLASGALTLAETCSIFVGQLDMSVEEPLHLVVKLACARLVFHRRGPSPACA